MSDVFGYLFLAFSAAAFMLSVAAEIHRAQHPDALVVRDSARVGGGNLSRREFGQAAFSSPSTAMEVVRAFVSAARRKTRQSLCLLTHGGHELYRARTDTRLFQQCLLCGYETTGWTIDRRDRRLHLIANNRTHFPKAS